MKIDTLHLVNSLSPQGINSKDNDFEMNELGVLITPKGGVRSFTRRVRFVPWANIKACDIAEEKPAEPVITQPEPLLVAASSPVDPGQPAADVIKFVKNERTGIIEEQRMPHRSVEPRMQDLDIANAHPAQESKSAFAKLRDAKAEPTPE